MIDVNLRIPYHGMLTEWAAYIAQPGTIILQVWRPAPSYADFPDHSYSIMGETTLEVETPGLSRVKLTKEKIILVEEGDLIGWRVDTDSVLPYDSMDGGLVRITKSPTLRPSLGRTEHFPYSISRTYSVQAKVISSVLLWDDKGCSGERIEVVDESVDFCSLRFLTGEDVNDRVKSVLVPAGLRVQLFQECGATDTVDGPDIDNRPSARSKCEDLPLKLSHVR
eukprot:CAMPEP_0184316474 /NCGR_PEP_ID=MMETSP1049-20130417/90316_1 /TAXON_ID=77928 /ORGANISM="Proteomonas sulcata, Strain CCMP704" /LENGTH=222 /DNA_ID=CAMNT_0026635455 /DNA_START=27 /DNA_END=692 /DNA_ORIENTATION=+